MHHSQLFINNEYVDAQSGEALSVWSPHDETLVANDIQVAGQADVDKAVAAARAAFHGEWSNWTGPQRTAAMTKFADLIDAKAPELAEWESKSMGQPISVTKQIMQMVSSIFRYYAGWTDKIAGEQYPIVNDAYRIVQYDPIGVCAGIGAWNAAQAFFATKAAAALAAGCTFIFKASEKSPIGILQYGELIKEAGFPPGVLNIISGGAKTGAMLASHMDINKISFTGSVTAGKKVQELATKSNLKRVVLELGGKSPSLIFEDADIPNAVKHHSQNFLFNTGQNCVSASRMFVQASIADKFTDALKEAFEMMGHTLGNPLDASTFIGPIADSSQFKRVMDFVEAGKQEADLVTGGARHGEKGFYVQPTIFVNPKDDAKIYREEIFGPVATIKTFETEEQALQLANDTSYGLSSCIFTASTSRALRLAKQIEAGMVNVNTSQTFGFDCPFGGWKQSGIGREMGKAGLMQYLEPKTISINMAI